MNTTGVTALSPRWRHARREYRHTARECSRLLFIGHLAPGTYIEIRCPACGRMHVIQVDSGATDDYTIEVETLGGETTAFYGEPSGPIDTEQ